MGKLADHEMSLNTLVGMPDDDDADIRKAVVEYINNYVKGFTKNRCNCMESKKRKTVLWHFFCYFDGSNETANL